MKQETIDRIRKFTEDRDWDQFHSPANLAKSIVIEAAELLECFQWNDEEYDLQHVKEEIADVMVYCQNLLDKLGLDADEIINMKMAQNEAKYPVEKQREVQRSIISCNILCEREKCVSNFWKGIRSYTVILGRIWSDSGQSQSHLNWQRRISETPFRISGDDVPFTLSWSYASEFCRNGGCSGKCRRG